VVKRNNGNTIDQGVIRAERSAARAARILMRRAQNINSVDLDRIDSTDCPADLGIAVSSL
jgi:hypothetical protein